LVTEVREGLWPSRRVDHGQSDQQAGLLLPRAGFSAAASEITRWTNYEPTPLRELRGLATTLELGRLWVKDESFRFGQGSFKPLGGAYAVGKVIAGREASEVVVASATDGNHGRSVAWGASRAKCRCVIYLHADVSATREEAIAALGAEIVRVRGTYDDSVRQCADDAERHGWTVVSDTSPKRESGITLDIMQGYRILVAEALAQLEGEWPTHVFAQGGCGGLAAAMRAHLADERNGRPHPVFVVVEPTRAACLYLSARAAQPTPVRGPLDTALAGLAVGEVSLPAWRILDRGTDFFQAIEDSSAFEAMRLLGRPSPGDPLIVSGETGAAGLGGVLAAIRQGERSTLGLDPGCRVLVISTEGDTNPSFYQHILGGDPPHAAQSVY
jgi:diaminopropionate ammonia-lyase